MARTAHWLGLSMALALLPGCRCTDPDHGSVAADSYELACRSACAAYFAAGCSKPETAAIERKECFEACERASALSVRAGCGAQRLAFLDCVSRARPNCEAVVSAPGAALERAEGVPVCRAAHEAQLACDAPCRDPGTLHLGEKAESQSFVELVRHGCEACPRELARGAAEGSACQAARVCEQHCCACEGGPATYLVRACLGGQCAGREAACREAPLLSGERVCAGGGS